MLPSRISVEYIVLTQSISCQKNGNFNTLSCGQTQSLLVSIINSPARYDIFPTLFVNHRSRFQKAVCPD